MGWLICMSYVSRFTCFWPFLRPRKLRYEWLRVQRANRDQLLDGWQIEKNLGHLSFQLAYLGKRSTMRTRFAESGFYNGIFRAGFSLQFKIFAKIIEKNGKNCKNTENRENTTQKSRTFFAKMQQNNAERPKKYQSRWKYTHNQSRNQKKESNARALYASQSHRSTDRPRMRSLAE